MRGTSDQQIESLVALTPEDLVPQEHPIRRIKPLAGRVLQELSPTFSRMYAKGGRPSVPPEHLLKASLLIALYSVRSECQFCERLTYDMLFRWFLDLNIRGGSFDQSTFAKNRTRLLAHEVTGRFFGAVVSEARRQRLLSEEHFSVDGTLLEAWASSRASGRGTRRGTRQRGQAGGTRGRTSGGAAFQRDPCIDDGPGGAVGAQGAAVAPPVQEVLPDWRRRVGEESRTAGAGPGPGPRHLRGDSGDPRGRIWAESDGPGLGTRSPSPYRRWKRPRPFLLNSRYAPVGWDGSGRASWRWTTTRRRCGTSGTRSPRRATPWSRPATRKRR